MLGPTKIGEMERTIDMMLDEIENINREPLYRLLGIIDLIYHTQRFGEEDLKLFRKLIEERIKRRC